MIKEGNFDGSTLLLFSYRYIVSNLTGLVIALYIILLDSRIVIIILGVYIGGIWSSLADAMPRGGTTIYAFGSGVVILLVLQIGLFFQIIPITDMMYPIGSITFTGSSVASSCMTNIMVFWIRNLLQAYLKPTSLTVIKSLVTSEKVSRIEARVLYAAFHLKEAARHLQKDEDVKHQLKHQE
jgi:hypothetical protein